MTLDLGLQLLCLPIFLGHLLLCKNFQASFLNQEHLQLLSLWLFVVRQFLNLSSHVLNPVKEFNTLRIFMTQDASYILVLMHRRILKRLKLTVETVPFKLDLTKSHTLLVELVWKLVDVSF